jgi:hypothetical protein
MGYLQNSNVEAHVSGVSRYVGRVPDTVRHCLVIITSGLLMYIIIPGYMSASDCLADMSIELGDPENMGFDVEIIQIAHLIA